MAPVRRSDTKHQVPKMAGAPGLTAFTYTRPPRTSPTPWASAPAQAAGGRASVANFIGGTTKQFDWLTKGRSRHLSSPPAIACSISSERVTCTGLTQLEPTCLVVADTDA